MKSGPIQTVMESIPGSPSSTGATEGCVDNGVPGYPKGSGGKLDEVTFDQGGAFGNVKTNQKG